MIGKFTGRYAWLSNFWKSTVVLDGLVYPTVEHAFQAAKTLNPSERRTIRLAKTPRWAKRLGRNVELRPGWEGMKERVMLDCLRSKFRTVDLRHRLLSTSLHELVEENDHGDMYWGVCRGTGRNRLGALLMELREELRRTK